MDAEQEALVAGALNVIRRVNEKEKSRQKVIAAHRAARESKILGRKVAVFETSSLSTHLAEGQERLRERKAEEERLAELERLAPGDGPDGDRQRPTPTTARCMN